MTCIEKNLAALYQSRSHSLPEVILQEILTPFLSQTKKNISPQKKALPNFPENFGTNLVISVGWNQWIPILLQKNPKILFVYVNDIEEFITQLTQFDYTADFQHKSLHLAFESSDEFLQMQVYDFFREDNSRLAAYYGAKIIHDNQNSRDVAQKKIQIVFEKIADKVSSFENALLEDNFRGLINTVRNTPDYFTYPDIANFKNALKGQKALVIGTAPSLDKSIEAIHAYQDRYVICAVDTSARILIEKGIVPDFVVCLERVATENLFKNISGLEKSVFIAPAVVQPETFRHFPGPRISFQRDTGFEHWFVPKSEKRFVGVNVGHAGYYFMREMGCEEIMLVGHDYAYDPHTQQSYSYHAEANLKDLGKAESDAFANHQKRIPGHDGVMQLTTQFWYECVELMSEMILRYGGEVIHVLPPGYGIAVKRARVESPDCISICSPFHKKDLGTFTQISRQQVFSYEYFQCQLERLIKGFSFLSQQCLVLLRECSTFWVDHDSSQINVGYQKLYDTFFNQWQKAQDVLLNYDNGFFHEFGMNIFGYQHSIVGIQLSRILYREKNFTSRINAQMALLMMWMQMVFLWSSRVTELLRSVETSRRST